jgi:hypothetical protein
MSSHGKINRLPFVTPFSSASALQITSAGFQFLLHSPHAQLWDLLLQYLHMAEVSLTAICTLANYFLHVTTSIGKTDGSGGSPQLFIHALNNGAWQSDTF